MADPISQAPVKTRIPYPDPAAMSDEKREIYERFSPMLNIMKILMVAPDPFWKGQRALGRSAVVDVTITEQQRELLVLRVAYLSDSAYELHHHLALARNVGLSEAKCEAMCTGDFAALDATERALAVFVSEVVMDITPGDATLAEMRAHFSDAQLLEVTLIVGYYMMIARVIGVTGIGTDEPAVQSWKR